MLGLSVGRRAVRPSLLLALTVSLSCAHNVPQGKATGDDGTFKGAKELVLENGEVKTTGIVTYPGGDRVDWRMVELPEKQRGTLDIKLSWTPPRPGLQLGFDVYDAYYAPVLPERRRSNRRKGRIKTASIDNARGKYFIRVYAVGRGDAGKYRLSVEFAEAQSGPIFDALKLEIPEPPRLAAVPEPEVPCDPFDPKVPACKSVCPEFGAPPGWPPCQGKCPNPPDINNPACHASMPCPNPPDRRVRACKASAFPKCQDINNPDPQNPNCDNAKAPPMTGRVLRTEVQGGDLLITIAGGSNSGVKKGWTATVLRGDSDEPLSGGDVQIIRIDKGSTLGKVRLTADQIKANNRVKISPP